MQVMGHCAHTQANGMQSNAENAEKWMLMHWSGRRNYSFILFQFFHLQQFVAFKRYHKQMELAFLKVMV